MIDLSHITIPESFSLMVTVAVIYIVAKITNSLIENWTSKLFQGHRIGSRKYDDIKIPPGLPFNGWMNRLIEALNAQAESNTKISVALNVIQENQRFFQQEQREFSEVLNHVSEGIDRLVTVKEK